MTERKIKLPWMMLKGPLGSEDLFVTPGSAAAMLEVHPGHVSRLIAGGQLDVVVLVDQRGAEIGRGVTVDSVVAYRKRLRRNRAAQLDLLPNVN